METNDYMNINFGLLCLIPLRRMNLFRTRAVAYFFFFLVFKSAGFCLHSHDSFMYYLLTLSFLSFFYCTSREVGLWLSVVYVDLFIQIWKGI